MSAIKRVNGCGEADVREGDEGRVGGDGGLFWWV